MQKRICYTKISFNKNDSNNDPIKKLGRQFFVLLDVPRMPHHFNVVGQQQERFC